MAFPAIQTSSASAGSGARSVTKPSGLAVGDLLIGWVVAASYTNSAASIAAPDGTWNQLRLQDVSAQVKFCSWWKIADANDVAASTFPWGAGDRVTATMLRISIADGTTPILVSNDGLDGGSTAMSSSGITPLVQPLLLMLCGATKGNNGGAATISGHAIANNNPSWTIDQNNIVATDTGNQSLQSVAWANMTGDANTATGNATATLGTNFGSYDLQIIAIQPPQYIATSIHMALIIPPAAFVKRLVVTSIHTSLLMGTAVVSEVAAKIHNEVKHAVSSIVNEIKH